MAVLAPLQMDIASLLPQTMPVADVGNAAFPGLHDLYRIRVDFTWAQLMVLHHMAMLGERCTEQIPCSKA